jgi:hypothetical protein
VAVVNGLFTVGVDFGNLFNGQPLWLEIRVRPGASDDPNVYQTLNPRQLINPIPRALPTANGNGGRGGPYNFLTAADGEPLNAVFVDEDGNVGVGLTNPDVRLDIRTNANIPAIRANNTGNGDDLILAGIADDGKENDAASPDDNGVIRSDPEFAGSDLIIYSNDDITFYLDDNGNGGGETGQFRIRRDAGSRVLAVDERGILSLFKTDGTEPITLDARSGRISTQVLRITGGADLSEQFNIQGYDTSLKPEPGLVVCIDIEHPGELVICSQSYDSTVAGIISGAGGVNPGMVMGQVNSEADGEYPVALTGRVYVQADASSSPIQPGDLLTTSDIPGYAMKVVDHDQAQGATLGKAMSSLKEGQGLVLVLVSLQ